MTPMSVGFIGRLFPAALLGLSLAAVALLAACGGGGEAEQPGERITDPARVPSSTPIQNPTLFKIEGNEVTLSGGASGAITPVAITPAASSEYIIKSGDFCSTIAVEFKITLDALQNANRTMDCNNLRIGDKLKIPSAPVPTPTRGSLTGNPTTRPGTTGGGSKNYTVKSGDTCAGIASANGATLSAFMAANSSIDANCSNLREGQIVTIP